MFHPFELTNFKQYFKYLCILLIIVFSDKLILFKYVLHNMQIKFIEMPYNII